MLKLLSLSEDLQPASGDLGAMLQNFFDVNGVSRN